MTTRNEFIENPSTARPTGPSELGPATGSHGWGTAVAFGLILIAAGFWRSGGAGLLRAGFAWTIGDALRILGVAYATVMSAAFVWRIVLWLRYRADAPVDESALPRVSVVIPAFNEGAAVRAAIRTAAASDYPRGRIEIIAIDDGSDDDTWLHIRAARDSVPAGVRLMTHRLPENRGKREALATGFAMASGDVWVTLDSDSELAPDALRHLVAPFVRDARIDCVAGCVRVLNRGATLITRLLHCYFSLSFRYVRAYQNGFRGVFCAPGAISAYRASAVRPVLDCWRRQSFLGRACVTGEDRALTNLVLRNGGLTAYQQTAVAHTRVPEDYSGMAKMFLRWARSNIRETIVLWRFLWRPFRNAHVGWFRFNMVLVLLSLTLPHAFVAHAAYLALASDGYLLSYVAATVTGGLIMAIVYYRNERDAGWMWLVFYQFFWVACLSWIMPYALCTLRNTNWLTRQSTNRRMSMHRKGAPRLPAGELAAA